MSKSSPSGIPGVDAMTDTFDFFKNMWSNVPGMNLPGMKNIPGMVMPTLSVDEIDKQIKDLKAVESWLSLNMNMLQGTIQALEVQRATISTLQTMGESFTAAMQPPPMPAKKEAPAPSKPAQTASSEKSSFESPFASPFGKSSGTKADSASSAAEQSEAAASAASDPTSMIPPMANPAAWWGMLQDQFKQAVNTAAAMAPEAPAAPVQEPEAPAKPAAASSRKRKASPKE